MNRESRMESAPAMLAHRSSVSTNLDRQAERARAAARVAYGWVSVRVGLGEIVAGLIAWLRAAVC